MISIFTLSDSEVWDKIVCSFKEYDVYYLSGYAKAFEMNGDGTATLIYFENTYSSDGLHELIGPILWLFE